MQSHTKLIFSGEHAEETEEMKSGPVLKDLAHVVKVNKFNKFQNFRLYQSILIMNCKFSVRVSAQADTLTFITNRVTILENSNSVPVSKFVFPKVSRNS